MGYDDFGDREAARSNVAGELGRTCGPDLKPISIEGRGGQSLAPALLALAASIDRLADAIRHSRR